MLNKYIKTILEDCSVCGNRGLVKALDLPKLPLTGIYLTKKSSNIYPDIDNALMFCKKCKHAQLRNVIDPAYLYGDIYRHRTSYSKIAKEGNDFLANFIKSISKKRIFKHIIEVGCNDLYLLKKVSKLGKKLTGIDPVLKRHKKESSINFIPKFIEEINMEKVLSCKADLIIASHTFEHLERPKEVLEKMAKASSDDAIFILEVPGFENLIRNARFDQVFHQHLQYFSLKSLLFLIKDLGFYYLKHTYNFNYWGGTVVLAFSKKGDKTKKCVPFCPSQNMISKQLKVFKKMVESTKSTIESFSDHVVFGYGAAQMLPILAYHLNTDMSFLKFIIDDDSNKDGMRYPGLKVSIKSGSSIDLSDAVILITALDSIRPILKKILKINLRNIIVPTQLL